MALGAGLGTVPSLLCVGLLFKPPSSHSVVSFVRKEYSPPPSLRTLPGLQCQLPMIMGIFLVKKDFLLFVLEAHVNP